MADNEELEQLKKEKLEALQDQDSDAAQQEQAQQQMKEQLKQIARQFMTSDARDRLNNIRAVKPELAQKIELYLVQLHNAGQLPGQIDDDTLKKLLQKLQDNTSKDRDIKYRRK